MWLVEYVIFTFPVLHYTEKLVATSLADLQIPRPLPSFLDVPGDPQQAT